MSDEQMERAKAIIATFELLCHRCRTGRFDECERSFGVETICPGSGPTSLEYMVACRYLGRSASKAEKEQSGDGPREAPRQVKHGDSGYIHPDAWRGTKDIGTIKDAASTGRKAAARMYEIPKGYVCEWARKKDCGGGVKPIVGCLGNPATDIHHGPDKNTLNNEKGSAGVGINENVHLICSSCHNEYHAKNDVYYPEYDRDEDQTRPWLPVSSEPWGGHEPVEATMEELIVEEERRIASEKRRGRDRRGRQGELVPNLDIAEEADGEVEG